MSGYKQEVVVMGLFLKKDEKPEEDRVISVTIDNSIIEVKNKKFMIADNNQKRIEKGKIFSRCVQLYGATKVNWSATNSYMSENINRFKEFEKDVFSILKIANSSSASFGTIDVDAVNPENWGFDLVFTDGNFKSSHHRKIIDFTENTIREILFDMFDKYEITHKRVAKSNK